MVSGFGQDSWGNSPWGGAQPQTLNSNTSLDFIFNITDIRLIAKPNSYNIFNQFDDFGLILGLDRLKGEKNNLYKQRLLDVFAHRANSTYLGMIYGITRELGLSLFKPFRLRPRIFSNAFIGENPIFEFSGPFVRLWRDKNQSVLELEIDRFNQSGPAYSIIELYNYINANSTYFMCDQLDTNFQFEKSMVILNQSNEVLIEQELVPLSNKFTLSKPGTDNGSIILGSAWFNEASVFANQVTLPSLVLTDGDYYINQYTGDVYSFSIPKINTFIHYRYISYNNSFLLSSPVILHNMSSSDFEQILFEQILGDDGNYYNGLPTSYGADKINELLSVYALYYGK